MKTPDPTTPAAVVATDLSFDYPGRRALDGVSFRIPIGARFAFLGPNGGGKTTLFRLLATLAAPTAGRAAIFGHDLQRESAACRRELGVVFQAPSLDLQLTVEENLRHQGHLYGLTGARLRARIDEGLDRLSLTDRRRERALTLSGGLRRRAEIAKALLHRPRLLLLDEPSTGLDPGARRELWATLGELAATTGATVVFTTHFLDEADRADALALLDGGRIVATGTPGELTAAIGGDVVAVRPAGDPTRFAAALAARFPELGEVAVRDDVVRFERDAAHAFVARLVEAFPGEVDAVTVARPTLEDAFLRLTGRPLYPREAVA